jgi:hypothetical protein
MKSNFYILGSASPRPQSKTSIFVDGVHDHTFRDDDIELSHWLPNQTKDTYKAGTSTEICFKFLEQNPDADYDLVLNNHLDMDGLLAVFTLCFPEISLQYKDEIIQAAEMGDFWAFGKEKALNLFQNMTFFINQLDSKKIDPLEAYRKCFERTKILLNEDPSANPHFIEAEKILASSLNLIETGQIVRTSHHFRFSSYFIPKNLSLTNLESYLSMPKFNEILSSRLSFWPQARYKLDKERIQLVSVEGKNGFYYDLWYPSYMWADTKGLWRAPGLTPSSDAEGFYDLNHQKLKNAVALLNQEETGQGTWKLFKRVSLFEKRNGRGFPITLSFLSSENKIAESFLPPLKVATLLAETFKE